jgi:hypothetical protein
MLQSERARRGISLEAIAESTRIRPVLLAAIERGDLSQLPAGFFRRAFVRQYGAAIGLPAELVTQYVQLVPERELSEPAVVDTGVRELRLTLDPEVGWTAAARRQEAAALADTSIVLLAAAGTANLTGINYWVLTGAIGLTYYAGSTAWLGRSLSSWYLSRRSQTSRRPEPRGVTAHQWISRSRWQALLPWRSAAALARGHVDS